MLRNASVFINWAQRKRPNYKNSIIFLLNINRISIGLNKSPVSIKYTESSFVFLYSTNRCASIV